jgi:hypothetical protein
MYDLLYKEYLKLPAIRHKDKFEELEEKRREQEQQK